MILRKMMKANSSAPLLIYAPTPSAVVRHRPQKTSAEKSKTSGSAIQAARKVGRLHPLRPIAVAAAAVASRRG